MPDRRLRWYDHLSLNLFWLALNFRNTAVGAVFLPYLVDLFVRQEIKNTALGGLRTAGLIVAVLAQPAFGLLSDRSTANMGRRRPFLLAGVLLDLVFLTGLYLARDYTTLVVALLLFQVSSNLSHGPLQGLIPDLVPEDQRGLSSGFKAIFELLPLILVGFTIAALVAGGRLGLAFLATGAVMLIILLLTLVLVRETPLRSPPDAPFWPPMLRVFGMLGGIGAGGAAGLACGALIGGAALLLARPLIGESLARAAAWGLGGLAAMLIASLAGVWAGVRATLGTPAMGDPIRKPFTWWVINRLLFLAAATSLQGFAPYFLMFAFQVDRNAASGMTGSLMTAVGLFTLITALPGGMLADRFGARRVLVASGASAGLASFLLLGAIRLPTMGLIYTAGAILGLATGLFMTANWALGATIVPGEEAGRYLGVSNLAGAGAGMIGSGLGGPVADAINAVWPGGGYFVLFACYGLLFLASAASLNPIRALPAAPALPLPIDG